MNEIIKLNDPGEILVGGTNLMELTGDLLADARADLTKATTMSVPIAQLATLGASVASLVPALNTVTQTYSFNTSGLYRVANQAVGDSLKIAQNGNFWGALKTADGGSKFVQLQSAGPLTATSQAVVSINPATMMMAVALFSIEQQLGEIMEMQKQILSFLEIEKESEIEADVETLSSIASKYKLNWDNKHFVTSNHKMVLDIQRTARKNMLSYEKKIRDVVKGKKLIVANTQVKSALQDLLKKFKYYRLSLYTFSMASLMEVMLSGNFKEEYVSGIRDEIRQRSEAYRDLFGKCSVYLEKLSGSSMEKNLLTGIGTASKTVGSLIGIIPGIKQGPVDEFLVDQGSRMKKSAHTMETQSIKEFAEISNPKTGVFVDRLEDIIQIYNHTEQIFLDCENIYLLSDGFSK
ncbi:hypothetical protein [Pseudoflavonifractor sp. An44]|uniref:hypothetical protein n=1 Tax=Pseudoflavonifractor sp. An44 TaxID=1965635 RepID=UPI0013A66FFB|nr:hypothetical protein [Pseudoflavonifractor sp. An44]